MNAAGLTPSVALSTGRIVIHTPEPNGAELATPTPGPVEMTPAEWEEYCAMRAAIALAERGGGK